MALLFFLAFAGPASAALKLIHHQGLGLHIIQFEGQIQVGSFKGLKQLIAEAQSKNPRNQVYLALHSPGGVVEEALEAGRLIRASGVGTVLLPGAVCNSACAYLFFSGYDTMAGQPRRLAFAGSRIGVHRTHLKYKSPKGDGKIHTVDPDEVYAFLQARIGRALGYLNEMGVPLQIQERVFSTSAKDIYYLTEDEVRGGRIFLFNRLSSTSGQWSTDADTTGVSLPSTLQVREVKAPALGQESEPHSRPGSQAGFDKVAEAVVACRWVLAEPGMRERNRSQADACIRWVEGMRRRSCTGSTSWMDILTEFLKPELTPMWAQTRADDGLRLTTSKIKGCGPDGAVEASSVTSRAKDRAPEDWRGHLLVQSASARLPGGVFVVDPARPKSGTNGLISYTAAWAIGTRNGTPCFDVDASMNAYAVSMTLCWRNGIAGAVAYSSGVLSGPSVVSSVSLIGFDGRVETLSAIDSRVHTDVPWSERVSFVLEDRDEEPRRIKAVSEIRVVLQAGLRTREVTWFVPQAARSFIQQQLFDPRPNVSQ